jgi:threonine synthase
VRGVIDHYRPYLDLGGVPAVTLGEGSTPLVFWERWGQTEIYFKLEGMNPTGSFKDRGMTVAISQAVHEGARAVVCASTGNTAASAAAYAARAKIPAIVVAPAGRVAQAKMVQALAHGATFLTIDGNFDEALAAVRIAAGETPELVLVNSVNPWRIRGQESGAYEVVDELGRAPAALVLPVGNAGNITAYFHGFRRYGSSIPILFGVQAQGASPLVAGHDFANPETVASAIRIGKPASKHLALEAVAESGGAFLAVPDDEILQAQKELAHGGIFVEPASAASYAGMKRLAAQDRLPAGSVVGVLTGMGLKDAVTPMTWVQSSEQATSAPELMNVIRQLIGEAAGHVAH